MAFSCSYPSKSSIRVFLLVITVLSTFGSRPMRINATSGSYLTLDYYTSSCPTASEIIKKEMECAVKEDPRNAASILRLHFHDCFVQGCDGSVLLDNTITLKGEKGASLNVNSLRGFDIVDRIKNKLESECPGIVSCADLLAIAARDAVILVGGPYWHVPVGRKDAKTASLSLAEENLPNAKEGLLPLLSKFLYQGLTPTDMVALVGAHTIGKARCVNFRERIYGGNWDATAGKSPAADAYLHRLKSICPSHGGDDQTTALDHGTSVLFDSSFYQLLLVGEGLLNSDQELYSGLLAGAKTKDLVVQYAHDSTIFFQHFSDSMVKLGNITNVETLSSGEVRTNCRFVNT